MERCRWRRSTRNPSGNGPRRSSTLRQIRVYEAVYRYVQHNGTITFADEKRFTVTGVIGVIRQQRADATISVESLEGGTTTFINKEGKRAIVHIAGTFQPVLGQSRYDGGSVTDGILRGVWHEFLKYELELSGQELEKEAAAEREGKVRATTATEQAKEPPKEAPATVTVKSDPDGADITVDGKYVGSTPSTVGLSLGDHTVSIGKAGFKTWQRTVTVTAGGSVTIVATLEAASVQLK